MEHFFKTGYLCTGTGTGIVWKGLDSNPYTPYLDPQHLTNVKLNKSSFTILCFLSPAGGHAPGDIYRPAHGDQLCSAHQTILQEGPGQLPQESNPGQLSLGAADQPSGETVLKNK